MPRAAIRKDFQSFLYLLNCLLLLIILGLTFLAQLVMPLLEVCLLDIMLFFNPRDRYMRSIVIKNFESHGTKNLKASMMFMVTLAFLVFTGANFEQIQFFIVSMSKFFAGANITAQKLDYAQSFKSSVSLDELKIKSFLDRQLARNNPETGVIEEYGFQTQLLDEILDHQWRIVLKQAGINQDQCVDVYGIDGSTLNSIDSEFFYPGEHLADPAGTGKSYSTSEITQMLEDIEDLSLSSRTLYDKEGVIYEGIKEIASQDELIFNVVVAECLRGIVFNEVGDIINLQMKHKEMSRSYKSVLTNIATDNEQTYSFQKYKARVVGTSRKFPGFFKFSGYKQINLLCPDIVMTKKQMSTLIKDTLQHIPELDQQFRSKVKNKYPPSTYDLPKSKLYIKVRDGVSRTDRNHFKNDLLNHINDDEIYLFDSFSFSQDIKKRMVVLQVLNSIISLICYTMGLF